jgi:hypothetical protein
MITELRRDMMTEWICSCGAVAGIIAYREDEIERERRKFHWKHEACLERDTESGE